MKVSQRDAVFAATVAILKEKGVSFEESMTKVDEHFTEGMRATLNDVLSEGFRQGKITLEDTESNAKKLASAPEMKKYVSGLISNWFRKDERLNGGVEYTPKNPGSRAGAGDAQLKTLKALAVQHKGTPLESKIQEQIVKRQAQITAEKAKSVVVDLSVLSPEIIKSLGLKA